MKCVKWLYMNYGELFFVYICTKNENSGPCNMRKINSEIITEIAPVQEKYGYYIVERKKHSFDYPVHRHDAYEINFCMDVRVRGA